MKRKITFIVFASFFIYIAFIYLYLFVMSNTELPASLKGTIVDPASFLTNRELVLSEEYSRLRDFLFFIEIPIEWIMYFLILLFGLNHFFEKWAKETTRFSALQNAIFTFILSFISYIVFYPMKYLRFTLSTHYGITTQSFSSWMRDGLINFWMNWLSLFLIVTVLYWLIKKSAKRWWLYAWFLSIPFALFLMFIQPVIIDPLYNDFYPLKDKALEAEILTFAKQAHIPAEHVFEVNMSEKTNALNAYVTGIGNHARIVLWDTTLNKLDDREILFIMAHEMAHYVKKHIYIGIAGYLLLTLIGLFLTYKLLNIIIHKYGSILHIRSVHHLASLPMILLMISILSFVSSPLTNAVSRYQETRADQYAIELTGDVDAAVSTFHELTRSGLSQVDPPLLVKWFRYSHPTMKERILFVKEYEE